MTEEVNSKKDISIIGCSNCGADLEYKPGTTKLVCGYCDTENEIPQLENIKIDSLDYHEHFSKLLVDSETQIDHYLKCDNCGAESTVEENITSSNCHYCDTPLIVDKIHDENTIMPHYVLPFKFDKKEANLKFKKWINSLWFAPNKLKKATINSKGFNQEYLPYWCYDSNVYTSYTGQRGEYYYETETYTDTVDGKRVTKTRQVRHTRWHFVSGHVNNTLKDVLIVAFNSLTKKFLEKLEPWKLEDLVPYKKEYLSGSSSQKYQIGLEDGFNLMKSKVAPIIDNTIDRDIGGDEQRIITKNSNYNDIKFKYILLPVFISAFNYKGKLYQFFINAQTGEVQGERPWSWVKITSLVLFILTIIGAIIIYSNQS